MKKILLLINLIACVFTSNIFAQEVRGCSTRRVIYDGSKYYCYGNYNDYYGWEITNHNSFKVSVDLILYAQVATPSGNMGQVVKTQSIILEPNESYIFKREEHTSTQVHNCYNDNISSYFFDYKAYKLQ